MNGWLGFTVAFVAGGIVGGLIVREVAIKKIEDPIGSLADKLFGQKSYASGETKTVVDAFLRDN